MKNKSTQIPNNNESSNTSIDKSSHRETHPDSIEDHKKSIYMSDKKKQNPLGRVHKNSFILLLIFFG